MQSPHFQRWLTLCVAIILVSMARAQLAPRPVFTTIEPPSAKQMAEICAGTDDLRECGRRIETQQLKRANNLVVRQGRLLTITQNPVGAVHFLDVGQAEGGESFSLFAFHAIADAVTLYHTKADKLGFMVVMRKTGAGSALPSEPVFQSGGQDFLTVDVCARECEQRVTWWRTSGDGVRRHAEFFVPSTWTEASAAWTPSGGIWIEYVAEDGGATPKRQTELTTSDKRWLFASQ